MGLLSYAKLLQRSMALAGYPFPKFDPDGELLLPNTSRPQDPTEEEGVEAEGELHVDHWVAEPSPRPQTDPPPPPVAPEPRGMLWSSHDGDFDEDAGSSSSSNSSRDGSPTGLRLDPMTESESYDDELVIVEEEQPGTELEVTVPAPAKTGGWRANANAAKQSARAAALGETQRRHIDLGEEGRTPREVRVYERDVVVDDESDDEFSCNF